MYQISSKTGFLLIQVSKAHRQRAELALNQLGLHAGQEMILFQLWAEDGQPQARLVEHMRVEPPTVTRMLQRMEKTGLVTRRQCPADARVSRVYLTELGRSLEEPVVKLWDDLEALTLQNLTDTEQALLRRLLLQMHSNLR